MIITDPWAVLGVMPGSDLSTVKKAYKQLVFRFHPDRQEGNENERAEARKRFEAVIAAYEQIRSEMGQPQQNGRPAQAQTQSRTTAAPQAPQVKTVTLSFVQAYEGAELEVPIETAVACTSCGGSGYSDSSGGFCTVCKGFGQRQVKGRLETCSECGGSGQTPGLPCPFCDGAGAVKATRQYKVSVPKGVADGSRLAARSRDGSGEQATVIVRVSPSELYQRLDDPSDLMIDLPVTYREACLGAQVQVPTPEKVVSLRLPAGTASGKTFRVAGHGMPKTSQAGTRGDLFVRIQIVVPEQLSASHEAAVDALGRFDDDPRKPLYGRA